MGEVDESIITGVMKKLGISRKKAERSLSRLVDDGLIKSGLDNFRITKKGILFVEKEMLKK